MSKAISVCGHVGPDCKELCDDYILKTPGLCYLRPFENRKNAHAILKRFPKVSQVFSYIQNYDGNVCSFAIIPGNGNICHVTVEDGIEVENLTVFIYCLNCEIGTSKVCNYFPVAHPACSKCGETTTSHTLPATNLMNMLAGADLRSLLPTSIISRHLESTMASYIYEGYTRQVTSASLEGEEIVLKINGVEKKRLHKTSKRLSAMRHDYVASEWDLDTDQPLSMIGVPLPDGNLTPDYVDEASRYVLELGTVNSSYLNSARSSYEGKILKYRDIVHDVGGQLFIVIVGINVVVSNLELSQEQLRVLTCRFLEVIHLESQITRLCGFNPFSSAAGEDERIVMSEINKIPGTIIESDQYSMKDIKTFSNPLTPYEKAQARRLLQASLEESKLPSDNSSLLLDKYLSSFNDSNSKKDNKRICNIPMVVPSKENSEHVKTLRPKEKIPDYLVKAWKSSISTKRDDSESILETIRKAELNIDPPVKHLGKRAALFKADFSKAEEKELAEIGIGGKAWDDQQFRIDAERRSKLSFHPESPTQDIDRFLYKDTMVFKENEYISDHMKTLIRESKELSTGLKTPDSLAIWTRLSNTIMGSFTNFVTYIFTELSYNYKQWTGVKEYIRRDLKYGISLIIHNPKGHIFVSMSIPKRGITILETGRLGPQLFDVGEFIITDFMSFNEPTLEHFIKSGPYMTSLMVHIMSAYEVDPMIGDDKVTQVINNILLLYLNNKLDVEELVTSQRYLFMKLLEDVNPNPWGFVNRFPEVLRSRLTVHYLWKTINLIKFYTKDKITKVPIYENDMILYNYLNIKSLYHSGDITLHQKINEFYYGYVISKERSRGGDRTFKVMSKLISNEYEFRDSKPLAFTQSDTTPKFSSNKSLLKFFLHSFSDILKSKLGDDYHKSLYDRYIAAAASVTFGDLSTLKASARNHSDLLKVPEEYDSISLLSVLKEQNKKEVEKRPKMIEAMIDLVAGYKLEKGRSPQHVIELLPWCLERLIKKGYFDSDLFVKPQHCGDREIHVLEVSARLVQFFIELFSKVICEYFPSETTRNPDTKERFVKDHYVKSKASLNNFSTHGKSADAAKWCHMHHTSHFAAMFEVLAPEELKPFLLSALSLWPKKRLNFPLEMTKTLLLNMGKPMGKLFSKFCDSFQTGSDMFVGKLVNTIEVIMGMFQGILHTTSSLYHTIINEVNRRLVESLVTLKMDRPCEVSVVQGSDDSGMLISLKGPVNFNDMRLAKTLLGWKEKYSHHLSILPSQDKTSIGTHDLIEYNSEWHSRHKIVKPTFRWVSACLEMSVTERFIDRFRILNEVLSQCLEGGASTLECAVIQLSQCHMHYILMGFENNKLAEHCSQAMIRQPDPLTGFMPLDYDISAGVTGVEFQLYTLHKHSNYGATLQNRLASDSYLSYVPDEIPSYLKSKDLKSVSLRFTNMKLYEKFINRLKIPSYEEALNKIDDDPSLIFNKQTSWDAGVPSLTLKVFSPGVKESVSNMSPMLRMAAASSYLMTRKCFSCRDVKERMTLIALIKHLGADVQKSSAADVFPLLPEYKKVLKSILKLTNDSLVQEVILKKTSKSKIVVFDMTHSEFPVSKMCQRRWFGTGKIPLSRNQFTERWMSLCKVYSFLSREEGDDGLRETCANLSLGVADCKSFIDSLDVRIRQVTLYDTSSKSRTLEHSLSRIYWPHIKLITGKTQESDISSLRSRLFSLASYWCSNHRKEVMIQDWIVECPTLNGYPGDVPVRGQKLKIFRDYLGGVSKSELISRIIKMKSGCIGSFTQRQVGYGFSRSGVGVWLGQVAGITVEISMLDKVCTLIKLNSMTDSIHLARSLALLISEFGLELDRGSHIFSLSQLGTFRSGVGTRVMKVDNLDFSYADRLEELDWELIMRDYSLRLAVRDPDLAGREYTILSDTLNSRDWREETPIQCEDPTLARWSVGELCPSDLLSKTIAKGVPERHSSYLSWQKHIKDDNISSDRDWNISAFRHALVSSFRIQPTTQQNAQSYDEIDSSGIHEQIMSMNFEDIDFDNVLEDWAEEVIDANRDKDEKFFQSVSDIELNGMEDIIKMLQTTNSEEAYIDSMDTSRIMPCASRFFSNLNTLSVAHNKRDFKTSVEAAYNDIHYKVPGLVGKLISIITREFHISNEMDDLEDTVDLEVSASVLSESIKTGGDIDRLDKSDILQKIELVNSLMNKSKSTKINESLARTKAKYERMLSLSEGTNIKHASYAEIMSSVSEFIIANKLLHHSEFPSMKEWQPKILEAIILQSAELRSGSLTDYQKTKLNSDIHRQIVTADLLNIISEIYPEAIHLLAPTEPNTPTL